MERERGPPPHLVWVCWFWGRGGRGLFLRERLLLAHTPRPPSVRAYVRVRGSGGEREEGGAHGCKSSVESFFFSLPPSSSLHTHSMVTARPARAAAISSSTSLTAHQSWAARCTASAATRRAGPPGRHRRRWETSRAAAR